MLKAYAVTFAMIVSVTLQVAVLENCFPQCWFLMKPIIEWDRGDWYQLRIVMIVSAVYY